ncbi:MAG: sodium-dependent transporter, partial [Calditrichaeota bacterium]|nr:sodium-dependent transporter [Calditrichota bacterium]
SLLSQGAVGWLSKPIIRGMEFLSLMDFLWGNISLAFGAFLLSVFVGWVWGAKHAAEELATGNPSFRKWAPLWGFVIRFISPVTIFIILLNLFWTF